MSSRPSLRPLSSLRNRMILIFLMIIIVPFFLFAYYSHIKSIEGISNANLTMTNSYLLQTRKNFEIYLNKLNDQVNSLIGNSQLQDLLALEPRNESEGDMFTVNMLTFLYQRTSQVDAYRVRVYPFHPLRYPDYLSTIGEREDVVDTDWFRKSSTTVSPTWHLSMPEKGRLDRPILTYIKRFTGLYDQQPRGIIATDLSEDQLKRYFSPTGQMIEQRMLLLEEDSGKVLFDSSDNKWTGSSFPSHKFIKDFRVEGQGSRTIELEGVKYLASYVRMDSQSWVIVSVTPLKELTGTIDKINQLLVYFLIVYLICCIGVVLYITVTFTQPIAKLVRHMRKIEHGDFHLQLGASSRGDEVGWLYRGFNSLIRKVEGLIEEASRSERQKKELEFQVLSHQINPHFLYNTLESIRWKAENHGQNDISEMVSALGNLLRLSLNQGKEVTTLGREIEQVKAYVQIEQARMGQTIRILYSISEELKETPFLRLLLQPLIENAIQHSIRDNFEQGKILISAYKDEDDIVIDILDNGGGIPEEMIRKLNAADEPKRRSSDGHKGVGLRNVNERLKLYFGDAYRLQIESKADEGTKITLRHPILDPNRDHPLSPGK